jgi:two-component system chemotaxis response regulator CheY
MSTILVVDDSATMRTIASRMLQVMEVNVTQAEHGGIALAQCQQQMPDGVLLDWNMPVMDGPTFLRELRSMPGGTIPKVIFCTSESDFDKIVTVLGAGADEFIMKPYDAEILRSKLAFVGLISEEVA